MYNNQSIKPHSQKNKKEETVSSSEYPNLMSAVWFVMFLGFHVYFAEILNEF